MRTWGWILLSVTPNPWRSRGRDFREFLPGLQWYKWDQDLSHSSRSKKRGKELEFSLFMQHAETGMGSDATQHIFDAGSSRSSSKANIFDSNTMQRRYLHVRESESETSALTSTSCWAAVSQHLLLLWSQRQTEAGRLFKACCESHSEQLCLAPGCIFMSPFHYAEVAHCLIHIFPSLILKMLGTLC